MRGKLLFVTVAMAALAAAMIGVLRDVDTGRADPPQPARPFWVEMDTTLGSGELGASGGTIDGVPNQNGKTELTVPQGTRFSGAGGGVFVKDWEGIPDQDLTVNYGDQTGSVTVEVDTLCNGTVDLLGRDDGGNVAPVLNTKQSVTTDSDGLEATEPEDFIRNNLPPLWSIFNRNRADLTVLFLGASFTDIGGPPPDGVLDLIALYGQPVPLNGVTKIVPWTPGLTAVQTSLAGSAATEPSLAVCQDSPQNSISLTSDSVSQNPPLEGDSGGPCPASNPEDADGRFCADKQIHGFWVNEGGIQEANWTEGVTVTLHKEILNSGPESGNFHDQWVVEQPLIYPGDPGVVGDSALTVAWNPASGSCTLNGSGTGCPTASGTADVLEFQEEDIGAGDYWSYEYQVTLTCPAQPAGVDGTSYLLAVKNFTWPKNDPVAFSALTPTFDNDISERSNVYVVPIQLNCGDVGTEGLVEVDKEVITLDAEEPSGGFEIEAGNTNSAAQTLDGSHLQLEVGDQVRVTVEELKVNHYPDDVDGEEWLDAEAPDVRNNDTLAAGADGLPDVKLQWDPHVNDECTLNGASVGTFTGAGGACDTHIGADNMVTDLHFQVLEEGTAANVATLGEDGAGTYYTTCNDGVDNDTDTLIDTFDPDCRLPGNQILTERDLLVTCLMPGIYPVAIKAVDAPKPPYMEELGRKDDNIAWTVIKVYCWDDDANMIDGNAPITGAPAKDGIDDGTGLYVRWLGSASAADNVKPFDASILAPDGSAFRSDIQYMERRVRLNCLYLQEPGSADAQNTLDNNWVNWPEATDADQDCLEDASTAQPGHPVDGVDDAGSACAANTLGNIVYSEGTDPLLSQINDDDQDQDCDGLLDGIEKALGSNPKVADTDGDGASDFVEMYQHTNPLNPDTDEDGIWDGPEDDYVAAPAGSGETGELDNADDNCPNVYNPGQENNDGQRLTTGPEIPGSFASNPNADTAGDVCDTDDDNDAASDVWELSPIHTVTAECPGGVLDPTNPDTDGDHTRDGVEQELGSDPCDPTSKAPASLTSAQALSLRAGGLNVPDDAEFGGQWAAENDPVDNERECDSDDDGLISAACNDRDRVDIIDGGVDVDEDGLVEIGASDDDLANVLLGLAAGGSDQVDIIDGLVDVDEDGSIEINGDDDLADVVLDLAASVDQVDIINGGVDVDEDGLVEIGLSDDDLADVFLRLLKPGPDVDNDDGSAGNPAEIRDIIEVKGSNTNPAMVDTDGDGCADWIEIADVNGDRTANILDVVQVAQTALAGEPTTEPSLGILDLDRNGTNNILDVQTAALNSSLVKAHPACGSPATGDTERSLP